MNAASKLSGVNLYHCHADEMFHLSRISVVERALCAVCSAALIQYWVSPLHTEHAHVTTVFKKRGESLALKIVLTEECQTSV